MKAHKELGRRIFNAIGRNVDNYWENRISHAAFTRNQGRLWAIANRNTKVMQIVKAHMLDNIKAGR